jgi:hypothetical protein
VHEDEMFGWDPLVLLDVPTDPRFRNTLRIYAIDQTEVILEIHSETLNGMTQQRRIQLRPPSNVFEPAYAEVSDLPVDAGALRLRILPPWADGLPPDPMPPNTPQVWAFVSVTNNETQHITVIAPQR